MTTNEPDNTKYHQGSFIVFSTLLLCLWFIHAHTISWLPVEALRSRTLPTVPRPEQSQGNEHGERRRTHQRGKWSLKLSAGQVCVLVKMYYSSFRLFHDMTVCIMVWTVHMLPIIQCTGKQMCTIGYVYSTKNKIPISAILLQQQWS